MSRNDPRAADSKPVALAMLESGTSCVAVARELGLHHNTVYLWAKAAGMVMVRGARGGLASVRQHDRRVAIDRLVRGDSISSIARDLSYSRAWVSSVRDTFFLMGEPLKRGRVGGASGLASVDRVGSGRVGRGKRITPFERCAIALGLGEGKSAREIAAELDRDPSTISREINRGSVEGCYDAQVADERAYVARGRPKARKLDTSFKLKEKVKELLNERHSPEQVAIRLAYLYPTDQEMRVSHEAIYQALYVQGQGSLRQELKHEKALRSGRTKRIARSPLAGLPGRGRRTWVEGAEISLRPQHAEDRAIPGHWEGDLVIGTDLSTALITLVERSSRFILLHRLGICHDSQTVTTALQAMVKTLPGQVSTITWDRGTEMARVKDFTTATEIKVYFADPHSPWQRGTNERFNRDVREYFPKGTNFSLVTDLDVARAQNQLNDRARVVLGGMTPREKLAQQLNDALTA